MKTEMIDLGVGGLKVRKDKILSAIADVGEAKISGIYAVVASRTSDVAKCDIIIETDDEVILFGEKYWNELYYGSWTDDRKLYENDEYIDILVKPLPKENLMSNENEN